MTIDVVAFIIGGILIGTAVVGGGFEIKEIRMPRVGAGVRIASLIVGSGFLLLGMGIWGANNPHLLAEQAPLNNMVPADTARAADNQETHTRSTRAAQPEQPAQEQPAEEQPVWTQEVSAPAFTGFTGQYQLSWMAEGVTHSGEVNFNGAGGTIRVSYIDPEAQEQHWVDQDLVLHQEQGVFWYVGSNARDAYSQQLLHESQYSQDNLRVAADGQGGWTIDAVCALTYCFPATIQ